MIISFRNTLSLSSFNLTCGTFNSIIFDFVVMVIVHPYEPFRYIRIPYVLLSHVAIIKVSNSPLSDVNHGKICNLNHDY